VDGVDGLDGRGGASAYAELGVWGMDWIAEAMPFFNKNEELAVRVVSHFGEESTKILTIE
jgi:hypothetical protein